MTANHINHISSNVRGIQAMTKLMAMTRRIGHIVTIFSLTGVFAAAQAATLDNISYSVLPGERVQSFDDPHDAIQRDYKLIERRSALRGGASGGAP